MPLPQIRVALTAFSFSIALTGIGSAAVIAVTEFDFIDGGGLKTTSNATQLDLNAAAPANVQSVTAGGTTYSNLIFPSASTVAFPADIIGPNASRGIGNQPTFDVTFSASPTNVATDFLILSDIGGDDTYDLQLLDGTATPIGNLLSGLTRGSWGAADIANNVGFEPGMSNSELRVAIMNLSDFGAVNASDIKGLRIFATSTASSGRLDPFIVGLAVIPEPSSAILAVLGLAAIVGRRRR